MLAGPSLDLRPDRLTDPVGALIDGATGRDGACSLAELAERIGANPRLWVQHVAGERPDRSYVRIYGTPELEVWVLTWPSGTSTALHDHGGSYGAFYVTRGCLAEQLPIDGALRRAVVPAGQSRAFDAGHVHDVGNPFGSPAVSVHVYSPPLCTQRYYDYVGGGLVEIAEVPADDRLGRGDDPRRAAA
jgi:hypothetical protein